MSPRILLIVELAAKVAGDAETLAELAAMETASRAEVGCVEYTMLQSLTEPRRFVVYEIWQSAAHLEAHRQTPHYLAFGPVVSRLFEGPPEKLEIELPD